MPRHCSTGSTLAVWIAGMLSASSLGLASAIAPPSEEAVVLARITLARQQNTDIGKIQVVSVEPRTWRNSGLGCALPGQPTLQMITEGYVVTLATPAGSRRVHVAGARALICDKPGVPPTPRVALSTRNIGKLSERARADLAHRLTIPLNEIQVTRLTPAQWRNSALDCPEEGETFEERPVRGYVLTLRHDDREFTYRTDSERVRPCPAIEPD